MDAALPRIDTVQSLPGHRLLVRWRDNREDVVSMAGLIGAHPLFAPMTDETLFATATVVDWGSGIEWQNGADFAADALRALAEAQVSALAGAAE